MGMTELPAYTAGHVGLTPTISTISGGKYLMAEDDVVSRYTLPLAMGALGTPPPCALKWPENLLGSVP